MFAGILNWYTTFAGVRMMGQTSARRSLSIGRVVVVGAAILLATPAGAQQPARDYSAPADAPYTAENVTVRSPEGHTLAGTLTLPRRATAERPVPAIVTITGSGPQDRDESIGLVGYRPFRQLADSLARRGIATLRMDDRGTGASTGTFRGATSLQFAEDIRAGLAYLRQRPEVDARRLGVVGHSEGAVIAPIVASKEPSLKGIVLLAGVSRPVRVALQYQMTNLANHDSSLTASRRDSVIAAIPARIDSMMAADPWMRFILPYDPIPTMKAVGTPVLILTGANDQQATPDQVAPQVAAFKAGGNRDVTGAVIPGLNHLFVPDPDGYPGGYSKLKAPVMMDPSVVGAVVDWFATRLR
jgi:dipeptidyl aminopeptidase/acylaminoacyl peptidase